MPRINELEIHQSRPNNEISLAKSEGGEVSSHSTRAKSSAVN